MPSQIILIDDTPIMPQRIELFTTARGRPLNSNSFFHVGSAFDAWHWLTLDLATLFRFGQFLSSDGPKQSSVCGVFQVELASELKLFRPFQIRGIARPWTRLRGKQDGKVRELQWRFGDGSNFHLSIFFPFGVDF